MKETTVVFVSLKKSTPCAWPPTWLSHFDRWAVLRSSSLVVGNDGHATRRVSPKQKPFRLISSSAFIPTHEELRNRGAKLKGYTAGAMTLLLACGVVE